MSTIADHPLVGLRQTWVYEYTDFVLASEGLRSVLLAGLPIGCVDDVIAKKAQKLSELADYLAAMSISPVGRMAGGEAAVWRAAVRLAEAAVRPPVDAPAAAVRGHTDRFRAAWAGFCDALTRLPDALSSSAVFRATALDADGVAQLFAPCPADAFARQFQSQFPDEPIGLAVEGGERA